MSTKNSYIKYKLKTGNRFIKVVSKFLCIPLEVTF